MKIDHPIPTIMQHLPLDDREYPIPYFVPIVDGKPEFRYQDKKKREASLKYNKCSVCGKQLLAKAFWFICGPLGLMNKVASDAPMHEECARYSLAVCPHLAFHKADRRSEIGNDPNQVRQKPDRLYLVKADKIKQEVHNGNTYIMFRPVFNEEYVYENNKLVRRPSEKDEDNS